MKHTELREFAQKCLKSFEIFDISSQAFMLHFVKEDVSFPSTEIASEAVFLESGRKELNFAIRTVNHLHRA